MVTAAAVGEVRECGLDREHRLLSEALFLLALCIPSLCAVRASW